MDDGQHPGLAEGCSVRRGKSWGSLREILTHSLPGEPGKVTAMLRGRPEIKASGASVPEAVGNLVIAFPVFFRVSVSPRMNLSTRLIQ
jgi:hypothetical protein